MVTMRYEIAMVQIYEMTFKWYYCRRARKKDTYLKFSSLHYYKMS